MIPVLVAIWDGFLELLAGCRALFPMLGSLGGRIGLWMVALWGLIKTTLQQMVSWVGANTVENLARGTIAIAVRVLVLVAFHVGIVARVGLNVFAPIVGGMFGIFRFPIGGRFPQRQDAKLTKLGEFLF